MEMHNGNNGFDKTKEYAIEKKKKTRMKTGYGPIKCRGTRRCIRNGAETGELWGIHVTVADARHADASMTCCSRAVWNEATWPRGCMALVLNHDS